MFALIDLARSESHALQLSRQIERIDSLYRGAKGRELAEVAPCLLKIKGDNGSLSAFMTENGVRSTAILVTASASFETLYRHFRQFLIVRLQNGKRAYFRYYDPRVLRVFLPTCTPEQLQSFFGPVRVFWLAEEKSSTWLGFKFAESSLEITEAEAPIDDTLA